MSGRDSVFVEAAARLHFGVLDLRGALGRRFGGLGAAVPTPSLLLELAPEPTLSAEGPDAERALAYAKRFLAVHGRPAAGHVIVHRSIPAHSGLGSGTQLGLAVARALAELHDLPTDAPSLAQAVGRGRRSAIGTWTFALGGFIVEGGRRTGAKAIAPLLARLAVPEHWRCVLVVPDGAPGLSGEAEADAFARLPRPPEREVERVAHLVLMQLLPALVEADLGSFGAALTEVQRITGGWFASQQGGAFAPGPSATLVRQMAEWGAAGVGQSSWGPAVYGLVGSEAEGRALANRARDLVGSGGQVFEGGFAGSGARVWRAERAGIRD
ncbi:MAG: beta-ribofuranosylaminobenzene 5'-phosphate synthase family protein [Gemmatimonadales bacterium]